MALSSRLKITCSSSVASPRTAATSPGTSNAMFIAGAIRRARATASRATSPRSIQSRSRSRSPALQPGHLQQDWRRSATTSAPPPRSPPADRRGSRATCRPPARAGSSPRPRIEASGVRGRATATKAAPTAGAPARLLRARAALSVSSCVRSMAIAVCCSMISKRCDRSSAPMPAPPVGRRKPDDPDVAPFALIG